jgi:hypothetical protein
MTRLALLACVVSAVAQLQAGLTFTTPEGWKSSRPSSSMRVAQFALPRAPGDTEDADLVVYYFGGSGGSIDANIERWLGQMQQPDGRASGSVARRQTRSVNGLALTIVDVGGTYVAEVTPGSPARHNSPNFRLKAAVVDTPNGPYFLKLTGPVRTVGVWDQAWEQFLSSLRYRP